VEVAVSTSCDFVVLVMRRSTSVWLVDVLRDWSALGLIGKVCVVDTEALRPGELRLPTTVLEHGTTRGAILQGELSTLTRVDRIRVCAFTEIGDEVVGPDPTAALSVVDAVTNALPSTPLVRLHVIGMALQGAALTSELGWIGWHNVAIAPENAQTPSSGIDPIVAQDVGPVRQLHFAAALSSLAGLWSTATVGPLDDRQVSPGTIIFAARTYTRHLSADAVGSELLGRLAGIENGYPVPLFDGASAWVVEDESGAVDDMAARLLEKHAYVLPRPRTQPSRTAPQAIGVMQAIRMFFSFLWQALKNAPRAFLDSAIRRASITVAGVVQSAVFGSGDSEFAVVVNGMRADGSPASWVEVEESLERLSTRLTGTSSAGQANTDLSPFWKDFISAGLTLLDAGSRSGDLPPRMNGSRRGIITNGARVAPDPAETYATPENIAAYLNQDVVVPPYDVAGARQLWARMEVVAQRQPHVAGQIGAAKDELRAWGGRVEQTYTGRVGLRLAEGIRSTRSEVQELTKALQDAEAAAEVPDAIEEQQRQLAKKLRVHFLVAVLLAVVAVVLAVVLAPLIAIALPIIIAGWLFSSVRTFMRGQTELFALLHRRRELATQLDTLRRHLIEAIEDLRRVTRAYRQYQDWTAALGGFIRSPLGRPAIRQDADLLLGSGFPRNHRFGSARPDGYVLDEVAGRMRRDIFGVGWLSGAWELFLADVPRSMGPNAFRVEEDLDLLFADPGVARESLLTDWSRAVSGRTDWKGTAEALRGRVDGVLTGAGSDLTPRLLAQVETRNAVGTVEKIRYEDFINGLDRAGDGIGHQAFSRAMWGPAVNDDATTVASTQVQTTSAGLGLTLVVTQVSNGVMAVNLSGSAPPAPSPWDASPLDRADDGPLM
jgi:hypothetical protein